MARTHQRGLSLVFLFALAGGLIWAGYSGWEIDFLPAQYLGYFLAAFAVAGLCGVNVWFGGPLDKRNDPPETIVPDNRPHLPERPNRP
jgi:hypothetical protein